MSAMRTCALASGLLIGGVACGGSGDLAPPVRLESGGKPIDVEVGHAAPFICDYDGDGKRDLLVGQFGKGKLRIYRNLGTSDKPAYDGFAFFQAAGEDATVPAG